MEIKKQVTKTTSDSIVLQCSTSPAGSWDSYPLQDMHPKGEGSKEF
jgi:hypothetical protein